jgi:hypothetical protein
MPETPETLAAILAEMRDFADHRAADAGGERPGIELLHSYADRIEAAAERERDEDRQLAAISESDEAFVRCARCDRPERAPGNAAALDETKKLAVKLYDPIRRAEAERDRLRDELAAALHLADECSRDAAAVHAERARAVEEAQSEANLRADRLADIVRRLSRHLENYITSESENDLLREARAAIGEGEE